ncbi:MAG: hypothetical protein QW734_10705 [Candidatus Bathyarchaeia archaeon]
MQTRRAGKMTYNSKILKAFESVIKHLETSISALKHNDKDAFSNGVWHAAAELEYTLFLFFLAVGDEHKMSLAKLNPDPKSLQIDQAILKVKELVDKAQNLFRVGDIINAYKSVYLARHYVFRVQESLTKNKHKVGGRKK